MNADGLKNREIYLVIDKSGSMATQDCTGGKSRWDYMKESVTAIAKLVAPYDPDGLTVIPFANSFKVYENVLPDVVNNIFAENTPMGGTDLAGVLAEVFSRHAAQKKSGSLKENGSLILVATDGQPNDKEAAKKNITNFSKTLDKDEECGILFIQVGKDGDAAKFLAELDDELVAKYGAKFDIVDTKSFDQVENMSFEEVLLGAIND